LKKLKSVFFNTFNQLLPTNRAASSAVPVRRGAHSTDLPDGVNDNFEKTQTWLNQAPSHPSTHNQADTKKGSRSCLFGGCA
ncbi:hypothetical protein, partial [Marinobacter salinexigens]|uniref:hypothetical protein n=1 Tax=Marinobacter salinexigens TaxID=2919747 RepID=UPI001CB73402